MITTTRLGLEVPQSTDNESAYPAVANQAMGILDNATTFSEGTLASRPAAGLAGRIYYATDATRWTIDNGSAWIPLGNLTPVTTTSLTFSATAGQFVVCNDTVAGTTVNLPAPSAGATVGAMYINSGNAVTVSASGGGNIIGLGMNRVSSMKLGIFGTYVTLVADGTSWYVTSGQQDTGWVLVTSFGTNVAAASPALEIRLVGDGLRLSGGVTNTGGTSIAATTNLASLPFTPSANGLGVANLGGSLVPATFTTGGGVSIGAALPSGNSVFFLSVPF